MRLHNTLTRQTEHFKSQRQDEVTLYTCGFTVYDYAHIGNMRAYIVWDTLRRVLTATGHSVKHVMNITDVGHLVSDADTGEDKLEKGARKAGRDVWEVAAHYTEAFKRDMAALNILPPNGYVDKDAKDPYARATKFIAQQIEMIKILLAKGFAYQTEQAIYFDVTKMPDYGELTGQKLADKAVGARGDVVTDSEKRTPQDFALWFFTVGHFAAHSMHWPSPWGSGFPGWHLECSAIIHATLGDPIDIHSGGIDLIGTHHVNEMAQTEAAFGHPLARYWLHNEFILVDGAKMSKSQGNSYLLKDITARDISPLAYRLLSLQSHYRSELNFSWESLAAAQKALLHLYAWADRQFQPDTEHNPAVGPLLIEAQSQIQDALEDDLNTPRALASLNQLIGWMDARPLSTDLMANFKQLLTWLDGLLGLDLAPRSDIDKGTKLLIRQRNDAKVVQNYSSADAIRSQLTQQNLELLDTAYGTRWRRSKLN